MTTNNNNAVVEFELALARLEWARAARCLHLPSQREALEWHVACCEAAQSAVDREAGKEESGDESTPSR